jgi:hypothetical protein
LFDQINSEIFAPENKPIKISKNEKKFPIYSEVWIFKLVKRRTICSFICLFLVAKTKHIKEQIVDKKKQENEKDEEKVKESSEESSEERNEDKDKISVVI